MSRARAVPAVAVVLAAALFTAVLSAHLAVVKTLPADGASLATPPDRIQVWFSQPPSPRVSQLVLQGPGGDVALAAVDVNAEDRSVSARIEDGLAPGRYEVRWRTAGHDGHVQRGTFAFSVTAKD